MAVPSSQLIAVPEHAAVTLNRPAESDILQELPRHTVSRPMPSTHCRPSSDIVLSLHNDPG